MSSSATPDDTPVALARELRQALSLVSPADRLKSAGDVGLLSQVVTLLCEVIVDHGIQETIASMLTEISVTVGDMRRCRDNREELHVVFIRLRKQVLDRDRDIDGLVALLARRDRPMDRIQLIAGFQREHELADSGESRIRRAYQSSDLSSQRIPSDLFKSRPKRHHQQGREGTRAIHRFRRGLTSCEDVSRGDYERNQAERFRRYYITAMLAASVFAFVVTGPWIGVAMLAGLCGYLRTQARGHRNNYLHDSRPAGTPENLYEGDSRDRILSLFLSWIQRKQG